MPSRFSPNYATARARFLAACAAGGASVTSYPIAARGPAGEELAIDVARVGPDRPARAIVVSSGLHGIEGPLGSAVQLAWLEALAARREALPVDTAIVLLHALNPFGFAWRRRANENNVDLNRNFLLDGDEYRGSPAGLAEFDSFINPPTPPPRISLFLPRALWLVARRGFAAVQDVVTSGQYDFPAGLFYGGSGPEETTRLVRDRLREWTGDAPAVIHLDFHTGLGAFADCKLLSVETADHPVGRWLAARFGGPAKVYPPWDRVPGRGPSRGNMGARLGADLRGDGRRYAFLTAEFGTYPGLHVYAALRAENQARKHPGHPSVESAKRALAEAFCPASTRWRSTVLAEGLRVIAEGLAASADERWEA